MKYTFKLYDEFAASNKDWWVFCPDLKIFEKGYYCLWYCFFKITFVIGENIANVKMIQTNVI